MLQDIRNWLNGTRDYNQGVRLLILLKADEQLLNVLSAGPNPYRIRRVEKEILAAYDSFMGDASKDAPSQILFTEVSRDDACPPINDDLYRACKAEADLLYKKTMNDRAILFSMANENDFLDPNMQDKINRRQQLTIDVVQNYRRVSSLYDRAAYAREHGRLPETDDTQTSEFDAIPPELVKQALDNARKALSKLKKKDPTPARIALMHKHTTNIKKLEKKWHSLQQANQ